ncbi:hypothetical protein IWQ62_003592 [Dispira parvispora]|uniref:Uncharacterized protein n=1 Tax=Dispira parvispora TaxID=1520584 RepID=A0A9W8AUJ3_9FUNG|nr:hypothetical protein IWQ62_003592 [Dispira parvispora]
MTTLSKLPSTKEPEWTPEGIRADLDCILPPPVSTTNDNPLRYPELLDYDHATASSESLSYPVVATEPDSALHLACHLVHTQAAVTRGQRTLPLVQTDLIQVRTELDTLRSMLEARNKGQ